MKKDCRNCKYCEENVATGYTLSQIYYCTAKHKEFESPLVNAIFCKYFILKNKEVNK